jgi:hypothetical protein
METIQQTINGTTSLSSSTSTGTVTISRNGDLLSKVYVTSSTPGIFDGSKIVNEVEVEIGGQRIDRHYEEWNDIWNDLTISSNKHVAFAAMTNTGNKGMSTGDNGLGFVQIPLNFWFCRNPGLALPLIALQYHEVKLKFVFGTSNDVGDSGGLSGSAVTAAIQVWVDYIYLDTDERRRFAQVSHEYLIEQVQKQSLASSTSNNLNFNHPVKEIIWTSAGVNSYDNAKLLLNGHDRFSPQEEEYFQLRQPYEYHSNVPSMNMPTHLRKHLPNPSAGSANHIRDAWNQAFLKVGVAYTNNLSDTEEACDGNVNGFSLSDSDGSTPTETKSVILQKEIVIADGDNFGIGTHVLVALVDSSVSLVPKVTNTHISGVNAGGVMTFEDDIIAASAISATGDALSIIELSENNSNFDSNIAECLAVKVGVAYSVDLPTTEAACDDTANGFCACNSDGSANGSGVAGDGKQVIVADNIAGINVGDVHYVQHIDGAVIPDGTHAGVAAGMYGGRYLTRAVVQSYSGGLLKYDVQVVRSGTATAASHGFAIWVSRTEHSTVSTLGKKINVYSFSLKPEEHQPSGTCNFSRIDNAQLVTGSALTATDNIYAVNYNVLRIMSGMGGLAYSN